MSEVVERYRKLLTRGTDTDRIEFFSDAVFAIALTLLVLDIRLPVGTPAAELGPALAALWPELFAYVLTFAILGLNWVSHHRKFKVIERYDAGLVWLNLAFLLFVALTPFPTSVLSEYGGQLPAVLIYAFAVAMLGILQGVLWMYAWRRKLFAPTVDSTLYRYVLRNILVAPLVFLLSMPIAIFWEPLFAMFSWILLAPLSVIVARLPVRRRVSRSRG